MTGDSNHRDWLYWLLRGVVELGTAPTGHGSDEKLISVVNVDYVAAATVSIAASLTNGKQSRPSLTILFFKVLLAKVR